ncbi:MAG: hypothetical protein AAFN80_12605 [Pseudomonadota bacterium]
MTRDLSEREKVWVALSDLFLDTDVTLHFDYIERVLLAAPMTLEDIDVILRDEVAPVCLPNLYSVAGEWTGFSEDWLIARIETYLAKPVWLRRLGRKKREWQLCQMVPEWPCLRARIAAKRAG